MKGAESYLSAPFLFFMELKMETRNKFRTAGSANNTEIFQANPFRSSCSLQQYLLSIRRSVRHSDQ